MKTTFYSLLFCLCIGLLGCKPSLPADLQALEQLEIFSVDQNQEAILLDGVINSSALKAFTKLHNAHPKIKQLRIVNCEGSINDDVNLALAKFIHEQGFDIHLEDEGVIASGGTDLFLAGHKRTIGNHAQIGVHSWAGPDETATDFPEGHKYHLPYIEYYTSVGFSQEAAEAFYYYTIHSAPADDIHWMTPTEIDTYHILRD